MTIVKLNYKGANILLTKERRHTPSIFYYYIVFLQKILGNITFKLFWMVLFGGKQKKYFFLIDQVLQIKKIQTI